MIETSKVRRRSFIKQSFLAAGGMTLPTQASGQGSKRSASDRIRVAGVGVGSRGKRVITDFARLPNVEVSTICDVDSRLLDPVAKSVEAQQGVAPHRISDFRRILDDPQIDLVVICTPDHWHAIPSILACQAGKHVYVEKPVAHNFLEGELMAQAARKYDRIVQVGIQSRSGKVQREACEFIRTGVLGKVVFARGWETSKQSSIGFPADSDAPDGVDYDMWLGPAPKRPFNVNRFHRDWRWFFDYGTGDLGNDGVHRLDYAVRGLAAGLAAQGKELSLWPQRVGSSGGKYYFQDAQEWPDTMVTVWEFPEALLSYELRIWSGPSFEGEPEGAAIHGEDGYVIIGNRSWRAYDDKGRELAKGSAVKGEDDVAHKLDTLQSIRTGKRPACDIRIGHRTSALAHLGNIAWRLNRKLQFDGDAGRFVGDEAADSMLGRSYRSPWVLPKV